MSVVYFLIHLFVTYVFPYYVVIQINITLLSPLNITVSHNLVEFSEVANLVIAKRNFLRSFLLMEKCFKAFFNLSCW